MSQKHSFNFVKVSNPTLYFPLIGALSKGMFHWETFLYFLAVFPFISIRFGQEPLLAELINVGNHIFNGKVIMER